MYYKIKKNGALINGRNVLYIYAEDSAIIFVFSGDCPDDKVKIEVGGDPKKVLERITAELRVKEEIIEI